MSNEIKDGAVESATTAEMPTVAELEKYLHTSVRPNLMPSTYAVLQMEFRHIKEDCADPIIVLERLMFFFRKSHPNVYDKLLILYHGLYLPPGPSIKSSAEKEKVDADIAQTSERTRDAISGLPAERNTREALPTLTPEQLEDLLHSAPTMRPPSPPGVIEVTIPAADHAADSPRSEMATLAGEDVTAEVEELVKQMKRDAEAAEKTTSVADNAAPESVSPNSISTSESGSEYMLPEEEDLDDDFHERPTLVEMPSDELINKSSVPEEKA